MAQLENGVSALERARRPRSAFHHHSLQSHFKPAKQPTLEQRHGQQLP